MLNFARLLFYEVIEILELLLLLELTKKNELRIKSLHILLYYLKSTNSD